MNEYDGSDAAQLEDSESNTALLQLQDAFVSALTSSGALGKIRAELRATALSLIRGDDDLQRAAIGDVMKPSALSATSRISLLLLYDFLQFHQLRQTAGVFEVEGGVPLFLGEQDSLLGELNHLPGNGPLLERLVQSWEANRHAAPSEGARQTPQPATTSTAMAAPPPLQSAAATAHVEVHSAAASSRSPIEPPSEALAGALRPESEEVCRELDKYEESIPFSDADGPIDESMHCDELENV